MKEKLENIKEFANEKLEAAAEWVDDNSESIATLAITAGISITTFVLYYSGYNYGLKVGNFFGKLDGACSVAELAAPKNADKQLELVSKYLEMDAARPKKVKKLKA